MSKPKTQEELEEELCKYCSLPENLHGVHCYGGKPTMCVDSGGCEHAYEAYLEEYEEEK